MARVRAAVLAAGRGVRMGGAEPKTLLPLGDDEPLMYYILRGLQAAGIDDVLVVTGFKPGAVQEYCEEHKESLTLTYLRNTRYASWGNFHSVRVAIDASPGMDLMVVNSDVVVAPDVYRRVASSPGDLVLAVEYRRELDAEDMRVEVRGSRVRGIGKSLPMGLSHAEYAGVSLVRAGIAARAYTDIASRWEWRAFTAGYYEDVYAEILPAVNARAVRVDGGEYAEVDAPEDVAAARAVIEQHRDSWPVPSPAS